MNNALKAIRSDQDTLTVGNYIVLFGGRDITGLRGRSGDYFFSGGPRNRDGSHGEFFTKATVFESDYTATGQLLLDWEHGRQPDKAGDPGRDDVLGYVNWKSAQTDDKGVWVERVLNRRNAYVKWIEALLAEGLIGTSSEPVQKSIEVDANGEIKTWGLKRDTLTVMPFEHRMINDNALAAVKGLVSLDAAFKSLLPTEPEPSGEGAGASCEARARIGRAEATQLLIEINKVM